MSRPTAPGRGGEEGRAANLAASPARCWPQVAGLAGDAAAIRADGRHLRGRGPRAQLRACVGRTRRLAASCAGGAHSSSCAPRLVHLRRAARTKPRRTRVSERVPRPCGRDCFVNNEQRSDEVGKAIPSSR